MILRTSGHTGSGDEGIARNRNPFRTAGRIPFVWDTSDEALVAGLAMHDREAALVFVRRFQRRVYGCALAIVGDHGRAEDIAQEAFVRAWKHADVYDARRGSVMTWLLTITRNAAIDATRVERARPSVTVADIDVPVIDLRPEPSEIAVRGADVERVASALERLPDEQRRAVVLASVYGRTAIEISEIEDIPLGTAKTRIRTGLLKLRRDLVTDGSS